MLYNNKLCMLYNTTYRHTQKCNTHTELSVCLSRHTHRCVSFRYTVCLTHIYPYAYRLPTSHLPAPLERHTQRRDTHTKVSVGVSQDTHRGVCHSDIRCVSLRNTACLTHIYAYRIRPSYFPAPLERHTQRCNTHTQVSVYRSRDTHSEVHLT